MKSKKKSALSFIFAVMLSAFVSCGTEQPADSTSPDNSGSAATTTVAETTESANDITTTTNAGISENPTESAATTVNKNTAENTAKPAGNSSANNSSDSSVDEVNKWYLGDWYLDGSDYLDMLRFDNEMWYLYNDGGNGNLVVRGTYDASNPYALKLYDDYYDDASLNTHDFVGEAHQGQYGITLFVNEDYEPFSYKYKESYGNQPVFLREGELPESFFEAHDPESEMGEIAELTDREALDELCKVVSAESYRLDGEDEMDGIKVYLFSVGETNDEQFVATEHYAVTVYGAIYVMDISTGEYVNYFAR